MTRILIPDPLYTLAEVLEGKSHPGRWYHAPCDRQAHRSGVLLDHTRDDTRFTWTDVRCEACGGGVL